MLASRVAVETRCLAVPVRQALLTAREIGFEGALFDARTELPPSEISDTAVRHLRKMLSDLNLRAAGVTFPTRRGYGTAENFDRRMDALRGAMRLAAALGGRVVVTNLGPLPVDDAGRGALQEALREMAVAADRWGTQIALQSTADAASLRELLGEATPETIGVDVNPALLVAAGSSPAHFLTMLGPRVRHVFASDAYGQHPSAAEAEVQLGRGLADFAQLAAALEEFDYRGWITVQRNQGSRRRHDLADALAYLRSL